MSKNFVTLHIVNDIPWSNLNRDDTGTPKRTILGGVERGMLSSQSLKRAARKDFESRILQSPDNLEDSYRSRNLGMLVAERAALLSRKLGVEPNEKKLLSRSSSIVKKLTGAKDGSKETITWLATEEIELLASLLVDETVAVQLEKLSSAKNPSAGFEQFMRARGVTGSLAIAAFGRMFANATAFQTEAALAVSPAISTHGTFVETDYFIAADDYLNYDEVSGGAGAGHLGVALYTSGVFYRTVTIDINELWFNWSGRDGDGYKDSLRAFLRSLIYTLPTGKKNSTAPYNEPILVLAEEQSYRSAYSISSPILTPDEDGYRAKTVDALKKQFDLARLISEDNYGSHTVSGIMGERFSEDYTTMNELIDNVLEIMDNLKPETPVTEEEVLEDNSENIDEEFFTTEDKTNDNSEDTF